EYSAPATQAGWLVLLLGLPTTAVGYLLSGTVLVALNVSADTLAQGEPYLQVYFLGVIFLWSNLTAAAVFRGSGDVWTPLKLTLGMSILNVALNYLFIFGAGPVPALGVMGAAVGAVTARACGTVVYLWLLSWGTHAKFHGAEKRPRGFGPDWAVISRMLR